jgi:two-component system chemotaxis response regulator CheY
MPKKILVVDDSSIMRQMVSFTLRSAGFEVQDAVNGEEALKLIENQTFDLIVTDLNMPVMDGIALIEWARKLPGSRYTPILMLTTEGGMQRKMQGKAAGATGWIVKPFDPPKLLAVISKVLL